LEGPISALDQAFVYSAEVGNEVGQSFVGAIGCNLGDPNAVMNCLAKADMLTMVVTWQPFVLLPVVDGELFLVTPEVALTDPALGLVKKAPMFMLAVTNPGTSFVSRYLEEILAVGWENFLIGVYGDELGPIFGLLYPDSVYGPPSNFSYFVRGSTLISDSLWFCPVRRHATFLTAFTSNVNVAVWTVQASFIDVPTFFGVIHGTEIPFLFGNAVDISTQLPGTFTPAEAALSKRFMKSVVQFMKKGNAGSEYPEWKAGEEIHANILIDSVVTSNPLEIIRQPPPGSLPPPFPNDGTRCGLYDLIFEEILDGKRDGSQIAKQVGETWDFWVEGGFLPIEK